MLMQNKIEVIKDILYKMLEIKIYLLGFMYKTRPLKKTSSVELETVLI